MTQIVDRLAALPAQRRALFEALAGRFDPVRPAAPDGPTRRTDAAPVLSFAQRRLWFVDQLHPGTPAYNVPIATRLRGPLDRAALRDAVQDLLDRHEVLRTIYQRVGEDVLPHVLTDHRVVLPVVDVDGEDGLRAFFDADAGRGFALDRDPPVRASLARLGPDEHVFLINLHHIVTDGWSMRVLFTELAEHYAARVAGRPAVVPDLPIQYGDFAAWQRDRVAGAHLDRLVDYWRTELAGAAPVDLPTDRPRPAVFDHAGESRYLELPKALIGRLRELGRTEGATLYMTMLAGFAAVTARYTGQDDVVLGTSVSGREHPATADLIGFFVNTLPLRTRVDDDPTVRELIRRTRTTTLGAYAHQELPFDLMVDALRIPRDPSRPPLTSVMFLLDETDDAGPALTGVHSEPVDFDSGSAKYDLMVSLHDSDAGVRAMVQYPTALFDAATVDRLVAHYVRLLEGMVADPDARLSRLPLLDDDERRRVLDDWNDTAAPCPADVTLHGLFEEQADRRPDAVALVCDGTGSGWPVLYREVEERANRLAHHLIAAGAGPDRTVALCLRRGPDLVVAILAVLKSGAAFVPLDPEYPRDRLTFMVRDAAAPVLVTDSALLSRVPLDQDTVRVLLDLDRSAIAARPATRPPRRATGGNLGYVIYTSGSTGTPKGIALEHRGVVNNLLDLNLSHDVGPGDVVLSLSSPSFDMSVFETLGMLGAGGAVVLPDASRAKDPAYWADLARRYGVTVWNSAPALLQLLVEQLEHAGGPRLPRLRVAFLGGDWIPVSQPDRIRRFAPGLDFVALGGATEASIHSIEFGVDRVDPQWRHIPYGRPMANQRAYILDRHGEPVPIGVPGELHLGGIGLARGYLNRPELTAEKFVTVRWGPDRSERLYRTGDLARYRPDGVIELLGRTDHRIKLNGLRIEAGEVETALRAQAGVRDAVAVARTDDGSARLIGYVVAEDGADVDPVAVRAALGRRLPAYAVPSTVVVLDALPLSPNGKVDRKALPAPAAARPARRPAAPVTAPGAPEVVEETDPLTDRVAAAWADVLGLAEVAPDDDFFALGGDSFAAVRAVRAIDGELRVVELFSHPTPRRLAERMRQLATEGVATHRLLHRLSEARPGGVTLVCFPHGGGDAIVYRPLADRLPDHLSLVAVSPPGHDPARPGPMVPVGELAVRAAEAIIDTVPGPFAVYGHCAGVVAALETTRVLESRGRRPVALHLAAALPEDDPEWAVEMAGVWTDEEMIGHLRGMGGFDGVLDERDLTAVLRMVRHDMVEAARFFAGTAEGFAPRLHTPLTCIIGDADDATEGYREGHLAWGRYVLDVGLETIPGAGHYFAKHQPDELAELLGQLHRPGPTD